MTNAVGASIQPIPRTRNPQFGADASAPVGLRLGSSRFEKVPALNRASELAWSYANNLPKHLREMLLGMKAS